MKVGAKVLTLPRVPINSIVLGAMYCLDEQSHCRKAIMHSLQFRAHPFLQHSPEIAFRNHSKEIDTQVSKRKTTLSMVNWTKRSVSRPQKRIMKKNITILKECLPVARRIIAQGYSSSVI